MNTATSLPNFDYYYHISYKSALVFLSVTGNTFQAIFRTRH